MVAFSARSQKYSGNCCHLFQSNVIFQFLQGPNSVPWIHPRDPQKYAGLKGLGVEELGGVGGTLGDKTEGVREGTNLACLPSSHRKELHTISNSQREAKQHNRVLVVQELGTQTTHHDPLYFLAAEGPSDTGQIPAVLYGSILPACVLLK